MIKKIKNYFKHPARKISFLLSLLFICYLVVINTNTTKIDPCKCIKISSKKDLGLSYDESYWNKCVDKYYSKDEMVQKCMFKD